MREKHIFFDLDHTLWDFEKNSHSALHTIFHASSLNNVVCFEEFHGIYKTTNAELWTLYGKGALKKEELRTERFKRTLEHFKIDDPNLTEHLSESYIALSPNQTALFPNTTEVLSSLHGDGFKMHIITNGFREVQFRKLDNCKLTSYFDVIVCSEDVGQNKPAPSIFNHAMHHANARPENSIMIGDDYFVDVVGAINVGMKGIWFNSNQKPIPNDCDHMITNLSELYDLLPWVFRTG